MLWKAIFSHETVAFHRLWIQSAPKEDTPRRIPRCYGCHDSMVRMDCDDSAILSFRKAWSSRKRHWDNASCTLCRSGSIYLMLLLKMPFMTAMPCGLSCALISTRNSSCLIGKKYFGYVKVAYRGLAKNFNRFNQRFLNSAPCNFWRNHEYWFKNFT